MTSPLRQTRRHFLAAATGLLGAAGAAALESRRRVPLGFDNFAVRALGWNARQLIDHAVSLECDSLFITDFGPFEGRLDDASLGEVRRYAADRGVTLAVGSWSICPTSTTFKQDWGTADEHLALGIRVAGALGADAFRVILGNHADRRTPGGIAARIADTVAVLRAARGRALEAGVKIAVENHAGDLRSRELLALVEEAGPEFVGVNFDSGNACWTLEDPVVALETLAPHVLTTSLRDAMVWRTPTGVTVQWTALGEGCLDLPAFFDLLAKRCPGVAVHVETISGFPRSFPIYARDFWSDSPAARADELSAFLAIAEKGHEIPRFSPPAGPAKAKAEQDYQLGELARSIAYGRNVLGLGLRAGTEK